MTWPRLEWLRELLSEDGSIWASIDDNEAHDPKVVMDAVLGRSAFVADIVRQRTHTRENRTTSQTSMATYRQPGRFAPCAGGARPGLRARRPRRRPPPRGPRQRLARVVPLRQPGPARARRRPVENRRRAPRLRRPPPPRVRRSIMACIDGMVCAPPTANRERCRERDDVPDGGLASLPTAVRRREDEAAALAGALRPPKEARGARCPRDGGRQDGPARQLRRQADDIRRLRGGRRRLARRAMRRPAATANGPQDIRVAAPGPGFARAPNAAPSGCAGRWPAMRVLGMMANTANLHHNGAC